MKKVTVLIVIIICITSCKKETTSPSSEKKIYWGNAIYNNGVIIRDASNYQSYPDTLTYGSTINLIPSHNDYKPYNEMVIGDLIEFYPINTYVGTCYLNNITKQVKGVFTTTTNVTLDTIRWSGTKLINGTMKLNMDNTVDIEYTDSVLDGSGHTNHYKILHFKK